MSHIAVELRDILLEKKSGRLIYRRGDVLKYFFFNKGAIVQVKTNQADERLGEILYRLERIPKEAHARLDQYVEPGKNIGEVLKTQGVISEEDLAEALGHQVRESVLNTFGVFDAEIEFQPQEGFASSGPEPQVSVPLLIEYGIRRMQPHPLIQAFLAPETPVLARKTYAYLLTIEEKDILDKITGTDPSEAILRTLTMPADQFWKSLYLFFCLGVVDLAGQASPGPGLDIRERIKPPSQSHEDVPREIADVLALRDTLPSMTLYQILNVPRTASEDDIKKAYFQLARRFHPDRFDRHVAAEFKSQIHEVFDGINNAYRVLSNKDSRRTYDAKAGLIAPQEDAQDLLRKADTKFRQGKTLHGQARYDEAVAYLEEAVRLRRDKADYYLLLAMCEAKVRAYVKKSEQDFLKAIELEPWNPEGYVGLGMLYKTEGLKTKAVKHFEKAVSVDPDHASAREALEELTGRKSRGPQGLFKMSLFGSKKKK